VKLTIDTAAVVPVVPAVAVVAAVVVRWRSGIGSGGGPGQPPWQQVRPSSPERHATTSVWTAAKRTPRLNGYFAKAACPGITSPAL